MRAIALAVSAALHAAVLAVGGAMSLGLRPAVNDSTARDVIHVFLPAASASHVAAVTPNLAPGTVTREAAVVRVPRARESTISQPRDESAPVIGAIRDADAVAVESAAVVENAATRAPPPAPDGGDVSGTSPMAFASKPAYLYAPEPEYPQSAREDEQEGQVVLRVLISREGLPTQIRIARSSGVRALDAAAVAGVKRWTFTPARQDRQVIEAWMDVPIRFRLK